MTDPEYHSETINGHSFRLRRLPGGEFQMGDEENISYFKNTPIHPVRLSPFFIGEFPVTQALWKAVMGPGNNPSRFRGDRRPVEQVSWIDVVEGNQDGDGAPAFLDRINTLTQGTRPAGHRYRLPTEAEWEYAARANSPFLYAGSDKLKEVGWYDHNSHGETKEVGLKRHNAFGLYDMSGNVYEWCHDWVSDRYYQKCYDEGVVENPAGPEEGQSRGLRGDYWWSGPRLCRVAYRGGIPPAGRDDDYGFRLVLAPSLRVATPRGDAE